MGDFEYGPWAVIKIANHEPEEFWILFQNAKGNGNPIMKTIDGLSESKLRAELKKMEIDPLAADTLISNARANPTP